MVGIKDMKTPESCAFCDFCVEDKYADMTCVLLGYEWEETDYNENHRDEKCPLVEIGTCKDCKHFHNVRKDFNTCDLWTIACADNHYCADFEKRGNEND